MVKFLEKILYMKHSILFNYYEFNAAKLTLAVIFILK